MKGPPRGNGDKVIFTRSLCVPPVPVRDPKAHRLQPAGPSAPDSRPKPLRGGGPASNRQPAAAFSSPGHRCRRGHRWRSSAPLLPFPKAGLPGAREAERGLKMSASVEQGETARPLPPRPISARAAAWPRPSGPAWAGRPSAGVETSLEWGSALSRGRVALEVLVLKSLSFKLYPISVSSSNDSSRCPEPWPTLEIPK